MGISTFKEYNSEGFQLTRSLLVPYAYFFIESIDYILLSSSEIKGILLISSVKQLCHMFSLFSR